jgi:osmotically-inducible protein OsmY
MALPGYTVFDYLAAKQLEDGSVLLTGSVRDAGLKRAAESAARAVAPGATILNRIEVLPRSQRDDRLRAAARREIYGDPAMLTYATRKLAPIHIVVKNGRITLEGTVESGLDRMQAETAIQQLPAVAVRNRLLAVQDAGASTLSSLWRSATAIP